MFGKQCYPQLKCPQFSFRIWKSINTEIRRYVVKSASISTMFFFILVFQTINCGGIALEQCVIIAHKHNYTLKNN
jgi:hypothetical protein